jgi:hypothetical protein
MRRDVLSWDLLRLMPRRASALLVVLLAIKK